MANEHSREGTPVRQKPLGQRLMVILVLGGLALAFLALPGGTDEPRTPPDVEDISATATAQARGEPNPTASGAERSHILFWQAISVLAFLCLNFWLWRLSRPLRKRRRSPHA